MRQQKDTLEDSGITPEGKVFGGVKYEDLGALPEGHEWDLGPLQDVPFMRNDPLTNAEVLPKGMAWDEEVPGIAPTLLASRRAASYSEAEANRPAFEMGVNRLAAPHDFMIGIEKGLGIDPMDPIYSLPGAFVNLSKGMLKLSGLQGPRDQTEAFKSLIEAPISSIEEGGQALRERNFPKAMQAIGSGYMAAKPFTEAAPAIMEGGKIIGEGASEAARTSIPGRAIGAVTEAGWPSIMPDWGYAMRALRQGKPMRSAVGSVMRGILNTKNLDWLNSIRKNFSNGTIQVPAANALQGELFNRIAGGGISTAQQPDVSYVAPAPAAEAPQVNEQGELFNRIAGGGINTTQQPDVSYVAPEATAPAPQTESLFDRMFGGKIKPEDRYAPKFNQNTQRWHDPLTGKIVKKPPEAGGVTVEDEGEGGMGRVLRFDAGKLRQAPSVDEYGQQAAGQGGEYGNEPVLGQGTQTMPMEKGSAAPQQPKGARMDAKKLGDTLEKRFGEYTPKTMEGIAPGGRYTTDLPPSTPQEVAGLVAKILKEDLAFSWEGAMAKMNGMGISEDVMSAARDLIGKVEKGTEKGAVTINTDWKKTGLKPEERPVPGSSGKNTKAYFIGPDGEWVDIKGNEHIDVLKKLDKSVAEASDKWDEENPYPETKYGVHPDTGRRTITNGAEQDEFFGKAADQWASVLGKGMRDNKLIRVAGINDAKRTIDMHIEGKPTRTQMYELHDLAKEYPGYSFRWDFGLFDREHGVGTGRDFTKAVGDKYYNSEKGAVTIGERPFGNDESAKGPYLLTGKGDWIRVSNEEGHPKAMYDNVPSYKKAIDDFIAKKQNMFGKESVGRHPSDLMREWNKGGLDDWLNRMQTHTMIPEDRLYDELNSEMHAQMGEDLGKSGSVRVGAFRPGRGSTPPSIDVEIHEGAGRKALDELDALAKENPDLHVRWDLFGKEYKNLGADEGPYKNFKRAYNRAFNSEKGSVTVNTGDYELPKGYTLRQLNYFEKPVFAVFDKKGNVVDIGETADQATFKYRKKEK